MRCTLAHAARTMRGVVSVERVRVAGIEGLARGLVGDDELDEAGNPQISHLRERVAVLGEIAMLLELLQPHEAIIRQLLEADAKGREILARAERLAPVTSS